MKNGIRLTATAFILLLSSLPVKSDPCGGNCPSGSYCCAICSMCLESDTQCPTDKTQCQNLKPFIYNKIRLTKQTGTIYTLDQGVIFMCDDDSVPVKAVNQEMNGKTMWVCGSEPAPATKP